MAKVAIVTGGNKGIGYHIVRGLCKDFDGDVYLTARDVVRGKASVENLEKEGFKPKFHQLDITDKESIKTLVDFINQKYGGWDLLVNNAGVIVKIKDPMSKGEEADFIFDVNYFGCVNVCEQFLPTIRDGARLVHVSSGSGAIAYQYCSDEMKAAIRDINSLDQITNLMQTYISTAKFDMEGKLGWPDSDSKENFGSDTRPWSYGISKIGMTLHAILLQEELDKKYKDVIINACSPGYCATDMTEHKSTKPASEGAAVALSLALLPPNAESPRGKYKGGDGKVLDAWYDIDMKALFAQIKKR